MASWNLEQIQILVITYSKAFILKRRGGEGWERSGYKKPSRSRKTDLSKAVKIHWSLQTSQKKASFGDDQSENDPFSSGEPRLGENSRGLVSVWLATSVYSYRQRL